MTVEELLAAIRSDQPETRTAAWTQAGAVGPTALSPLADLLPHGNLEVARSAKNAMWKITRTVGAPGAAEKPAALAILTSLLSDAQPEVVRREVLWMLSEIGDADCVPAIIRWLFDAALCDDGRMALERIPGPESLAALQAAFETAPETMKYPLAQSLRNRGATVAGYECQKLVPQRETTVRPL
jgi:HEAT repeat protein